MTDPVWTVNAEIILGLLLTIVVIALIFMEAANENTHQ